MFGSDFTLGFTLSDVTTQVTAFLSNPVIVGLIATSLALLIIPRIIVTVKSSLGGSVGAVQHGVNLDRGTDATGLYYGHTDTEDRDDEVDEFRARYRAQHVDD